MVTVAPGFSPSASAGAAVSDLFADGSPGFGFGDARVSAETITIGSPPNGSSTNRIHPASTATQSPSTPAMLRETSHVGTMNGFFFFFGRWPSGFERSSVDSVAPVDMELGSAASRARKAHEASLTAER
jgi:hypothetical protein